MRRFLRITWLLALAALLSACALQAPPTAGSQATASFNPAEETQQTAASAGDPAGELPDPLSGELIVFAAASLTEAFQQIGDDFATAYPGSTVTFNFAGSQQLAQQLGQGAPADVFASANSRQMEVVVESGRVVSGTEHTFVRNRLVVIYPTGNPAGLTSLQDLAQPGFKLILAAPAVPVGAYSLDFLDRASATVEYGATYSQTVLANVVSYEESVRAVLSKVLLGEADAGIVYTSDISRDAAEKVGRIDITDDLNTIATYPIAPLADAQAPELAQEFINYVLSPDGQAVLAQYGFIPGAGPSTGEAPASAQ